MRTILVPGTWAWDGDITGQDFLEDKVSWFEDGSPFSATYRQVFKEKPEPFLWSTALGGIGFGSKDLRVWKAAGLHLKHFVENGREGPVNLVTHSHGLQVALFAIASGLVVERLVDVCGPFRRDMKHVSEVARLHVGHWVHFRGDWWKDYMEGLGGWFDSWNPTTWFRNTRENPYADENIHVPGADHSSLLVDPKQLLHVIKALKGSEIR